MEWSRKIQFGSSVRRTKVAGVYIVARGDCQKRKFRLREVPKGKQLPSTAGGRIEKRVMADRAGQRIALW